MGDDWEKVIDPVDWTLVISVRVKTGLLVPSGSITNTDS